LELGYQEPLEIEETIRRAIRWELANPPAVPFLAHFDYAAEDAALEGYRRP
jgi:hypothetical protein